VEDIDVEVMLDEEIEDVLDEVVTNLLERETAAAPAITITTIITTATRIRLIPEKVLLIFICRKRSFKIGL
jgi:hypothetical protein